jgi:hypothetical protein
MNWQTKLINPKREEPPKVNIQYPCPGLSRLFGMISFMVVSLSIFYGGIKIFGLEPLDMLDPKWTVGHVILVVVASIFGCLGGLFGFGLGMTINLKNERLNDFFIYLWQFLANGSLLWIAAIGIAMTITLGKEEAKTAVMLFGAERAVVYVLVGGCVVGLLLGIIFFLSSTLRIPFILYIVFSAGIPIVAARFQLSIYNIDGNWWIAAGLFVSFFLHFLAVPMIERDRRQRRLSREQLQ